MESEPLPRRHQSLVRFAAVGIINTLADISIYTVLQSSHVPIVLANICSTTVGLIISFILNRHYTFQAHGAALRQQLIRFFPVTLAGLWILQPITIYLVHHAVTLPTTMHASIIIPKLAATVISLAWNYLWYSRYVFKASFEPTSLIQ